MSGGRLKLDVLAAGAVVPAFQMAEAVHSGVLDAGHGVCAYWYGKHKAYSLFGTPPSFGWDAHGMLAWFYYGGGEALYKELVNDILKLNLIGFLYFPMPTQPLGWFKKEIKSGDDFKGMKYRTVGLSADLFKEMGAAVTILPGGEIVPAMDRGLLDAAEFNNPSSDILLGFPDVSKFYMMGSHHQQMESFEIIFNKAKFDALPAGAEGDPALCRDRRLHRSALVFVRPLHQGPRRDQEARRQCHQDQLESLRRPDRGLGQGDRRPVQGAVLREGDRLAEGLGEAHQRLSEHEQHPERRTGEGLQALLRLISSAAAASRTARRSSLSRQRSGRGAQSPMDVFALIGGPKQLPLLAYLLPIPIVLWLFAAEFKDAVRRTPNASMGERSLYLVDSLSTAFGKTYAWCILILTFTTSYEVFSRYMFGAPTEWAFDASYMLYGTLFMMAGAYALSRNCACARRLPLPGLVARGQAGMDLVLYILFFFPGMLAFIYSGYGFAELSRGMNEHSAASPNGPIVWPFKWLISIVGVPDGACRASSR